MFAAPLGLARDLAIIVNSSNATSTVTAAELEKLLKTSAQNWPDSKRVKVFLTDPSSVDNKMILQRAYKMRPEEIKNLVDTHKTDIQVVSSDDVILTMVNNNPGAIGVVNVYSINSHVKVLKVDEKLPVAAGVSASWQLREENEVPAYSSCVTVAGDLPGDRRVCNVREHTGRRWCCEAAAYNLVAGSRALLRDWNGSLRESPMKFCLKGLERSHSARSQPRPGLRLDLPRYPDPTEEARDRL